ncbi:MAG: hypothetical protein AAGC56_08700 [Pseudomonadota bacterium]
MLNERFFRALIAAALAMSAACSTTAEQRAARERNPAPCPNAVVLKDAARLVEFADPAAPSLQTVKYSGEVTDVALVCRYFADKPIQATLDVGLAFGRGPDGEEKNKEFSYFVAVTRRDLEVIEKAVFTVPVSFSDKKNVRVLSERIDELVIPRAKATTAGTNFEVVVGLVLTPDQARYNRSGRSLKFPDLKP